MAVLNAAFKEGLLIIKKNGNGRIMRTNHDYIKLDYLDCESMIRDAQELNPLGYTTILNRQMYEMELTI
jgi:hypothetical protein